MPNGSGTVWFQSLSCWFAADTCQKNPTKDAMKSRIGKKSWHACIIMSEVVLPPPLPELL